MYLNKKNLNRISRKSATIIDVSPSYKSAFSTISTFGQIKKTNQIIDNQRTIKSQVPIKLEKNSFYNKKTDRRDYFNYLSLPKHNYKQEGCRRKNEHDRFYQTARQKLVKERQKIWRMNRTISHSSGAERNLKSFYNQSPIDLQR